MSSLETDLSEHRAAHRFSIQLIINIATERNSQFANSTFSII